MHVYQLQWLLSISFYKFLKCRRASNRALCSFNYDIPTTSWNCATVLCCGAGLDEACPRPFSTTYHVPGNEYS